MPSKPASGQSTDLDLTNEGVKYVTLATEITFFTNTPLSKCSAALAEIQQKFLQWCPPEEVKFYQTETMSRFKTMTPKVPGMLATWFKKSVKPRDLVGLVIKNGNDPRDAPSWKFQILGEENEQGKESDWPNIINLTMPANIAQERSAELLVWTREIADLLPYQSGQAGYVFECCHFARKPSFQHAWAKSLLHPGINLALGGRDDTIATGRQALKSVNWLTLLGKELVSSLGGEKALKHVIKNKEVTLISCGEGLLVQAGPTPALGNVNKNELLPAYRSVYQALQPLVKLAADQAGYLALDKDAATNTRRWYLRFDDAQ